MNRGHSEPRQQAVGGQPEYPFIEHRTNSADHRLYAHAGLCGYVAYADGGCPRGEIEDALAQVLAFCRRWLAAATAHVACSAVQRILLAEVFKHRGHPTSAVVEHEASHRIDPALHSQAHILVDGTGNRDVARKFTRSSEEDIGSCFARHVMDGMLPLDRQQRIVDLLPRQVELRGYQFLRDVDIVGE